MKLSTLLAAAAAAAAIVPAVQSAEEQPAPARSKLNLEKLFRKMDADFSGSISLEEFKKTRANRKNVQTVEESFKQWDKDGSGTLSLEEFEANYRPSRRRGKAAPPPATAQPPAAPSEPAQKTE